MPLTMYQACALNVGAELRKVMEIFHGVTLSSKTFPRSDAYYLRLASYVECRNDAGRCLSWKQMLFTLNYGDLEGDGDGSGS